MNQSTFTFYRTANGSLFRDAGLVLEPYEFSYTSGNRLWPISKSSKSDEFKIEIPGADCDWDPDQDNLIISRVCTVNRPRALFGKNKGVSTGDGKLGVAVVLSSSESSVRLTIPYDGSISDTEDSVELKFNFELLPETLRGNFKLKTVLYLKTPSSGEVPQYLSRLSGTTLGTPEERPVVVYVDNNSPEFPTFVRKDGRDKPLWRLSIDWKNPLTDEFVKSVSVFLNEDCPEYKTLKMNSENKNSALLNEIYSSAILQIIARLRDEDKDVWKYTIEGDPDAVGEGSVSDFVFYMMSQRFNSDGTDLVSLSYAIRKTLQE